MVATTKDVAQAGEEGELSQGNVEECASVNKGKGQKENLGELETSQAT